MSKLKFEDRVAIITGAGVGLGRSHAMELARRGVKVVVNDLGGAADGTGASKSVAQTVVDEIIAEGGEAMANGANVTNEDEINAMVADTIAKWGHVDILVNNAGILRDKSFSKMELSDFRTVVDVHLMGTAICTKAVWNHMREREYGRIVVTSSSSGLYGNFGQSNYGAAKTGVIGLMNVLCIEGASKNIRINALSPTAATRMTEGLMPEEAFNLLTVESVTAGLVSLVHDDAPNRTTLCAGAGGYAAVRTYETEGIFLPVGEQTAEAVAANMEQILDPTGQAERDNGSGQSIKFVGKAMAAQK